MRSDRFVAGIGYCFSLTADLAGFLLAFGFVKEDPVLLFPKMLLVYGPFMFVLNVLFLTKERSMTSLFVFNLLFTAALMAVTTVFDCPEGVVPYLFTAFIICTLTAYVVWCILEPPTVSSQLTLFDISVVILVILVFLAALRGMPRGYCIPAAAACVFSLVGLIAKRIDRALGLKEAGLLTGAFAVIGGVTALFVTAAARPAGSGLIRAAQTVADFAIAAGRFVLKVLYFLLSLLPYHEEESPLMPADATEEIEMEIEEMDIAIPAWIPVLCILIAAGLLVLFLVNIRKARIGGKRLAGRVQNTGSSRFSLKEWVETTAASIRQGVKNRRWLRTMRYTPEGLYFNMVKACGRGEHARGEGETPAEFVRRMTALIKADRAAKGTGARRENSTETKGFPAAAANTPVTADERMFNLLDNLPRELNAAFYADRSAAAQAAGKDREAACRDVIRVVKKLKKNRKETTAEK